MNREPIPNRRNGHHFGFEHEGVRFRAMVGMHADGRIFEVFLNASKYDSLIDAFSSDAGIMISKLLQGGMSIAELREMFRTKANGASASPVGTVLRHMEELQRELAAP